MEVTPVMYLCSEIPAKKSTNFIMFKNVRDHALLHLTYSLVINVFSLLLTTRLL